MAYYKDPITGEYRETAPEYTNWADPVWAAAQGAETNSGYNKEPQDPGQYGYDPGDSKAPGANTPPPPPDELAGPPPGWNDITNPEMFKFQTSPEYQQAFANAGNAFSDYNTLMKQAASAGGAAFTPYGSMSGEMLANAAQGQASQAQFQAYGRSPEMQAAAFNQQQYMNNFLQNQGALANISQDRTSALGQSLEAIAARNARLGGEAALAAMPGARNSGAGMAAFGEAYASPFAQAQAQTQAAQLGLYGQLAGQAMGQYGSNAQFGSNLQQQANQSNQQMAGQYGIASGNMANQVGMQNAQLGTQASLANADMATRVNMQNAQNQMGWSLAEKQQQEAAAQRQIQLAQLFGSGASSALGQQSALGAQGSQWYSPTLEYTPTPEEKAMAAKAQSRAGLAAFFGLGSAAYKYFAPMLPF